MLRTTVSALEFYDPTSRDMSEQRASKQLSGLLRSFPHSSPPANEFATGMEPVKPNPEFNIAANFLYMLKGEPPSEHDAESLTWRSFFTPITS